MASENFLQTEGGIFDPTVVERLPGSVYEISLKATSMLQHVVSSRSIRRQLEFNLDAEPTDPPPPNFNVEHMLHT